MGRLLAAAAKQKGITALKPHDQAMAAGQFHQHRVGAWLRHGMVTTALADKVELAALGHQIQKGLRHQGVVDESIALPQQPVGLEGEQLRITGTRPHQVNRAELGRGTHGRASSSASSSWRRPGRCSNGGPTCSNSWSVSRLAARARGRAGAAKAEAARAGAARVSFSSAR